MSTRESSWRATTIATEGTTAQGGEPGSSHWPHAGVTLGRYELRRRVGIGGMGEVWAAYDVELDRDVAIKLVRTRDAAAAGVQFERLAREARALARVSDPHVVQVYDVGTYSRDGVVHGVFVVMELVRGLTLDQWIATRQPESAQILDAFDAAARGLAAAHAAGLVHRDFKPSNVFVGDDGRVRVGDFGLARAAESTDAIDAADLAESRPRAIDETSLGTLTRTGAVAGTPLYMAPEQHEMAALDARSDQYAFCVALWEALFGVRPFAGNATALFAAKRAGPPTRPSEGRSVPRAIEMVLRRGLAPDPGRRWPDMQALLEALRKAGRRTRRWPMLAAVVGIGAAGLLLFALDEPRAPCLEIRPTALTPEQRERLSPHERAATIADDYFETIVRARAEVCGRPPQERASSLQCLRGAAVQAETTFQLIGETARADVDLARMVSGLPDVDDCLDASSAASAQVEPAVQARLDDLGRGQALVRGNRFAEALEISESVLAAIDDGRVARAPLHLRAMYLRAKALDGMASNERTYEAFTDAYFEAVEQGDHAVAFGSARLMAHGLAGRFQLDEAERWLRHAETEAALLSKSSEDLVALATTRGALAIARSDFAGAAEEFKEAISVCEATSCSGRAGLLLNLAETYERQDRIPEATEAARASLELYVSTFGADSPATIRPHVELTSLLMNLARFDEAEAQLAIVEPLIERWLGPYDSVRPVALALRGHLVGRHGDLQARITAYEAAMAAMDPADRTHEMQWVPHLNDLANAYHAAGRSADALDALARAHEITSREAPRSFEHGVILASMGALRSQYGDHEAGARDLQSAADLLGPMLGPRHDMVMRVRYNLGAALADAEHPRESEAVLQELLDDLSDMPADAQWRVDTTVALALAKERFGDLEGARALVAGLEGIDAGEREQAEKLAGLRERLFPKRR